MKESQGEKDYDLSPAMRKALVNEWWALPQFTLLPGVNRLTHRALEKRGLVERGRLTAEGREVARREWIKSVSGSK